MPNDNAETQSTLSYRRDAPHPPVFWAESSDLLDCKGFEFFGNDKESVRV